MYNYEIVGKTNHKSNMLPDVANASGLAAYPHGRSLPPFMCSTHWECNFEKVAVAWTGAKAV